MKRARPISRFLRFLRGREGVAFIEFAFALPLLLILLLGGIEMTRYILIVQKVEKTAATISDVVAQASALTTGDLDNIMTAGAQMMLPYNFGGNGYVIISSVSPAPTGNPAYPERPVVQWQYGGGGTWVQPSQVGVAGGVATLPSGLALSDSENIIVAEVFYNYQPLVVNNVIATGPIYRMNIYKPRFGALTSLSWLLPRSPQVLL